MDKIDVCDKIMIEKQKKRGMKIKEIFYINPYLKLKLMPEGALTLFTVCDAYRYFVGQACLLRSKRRSRREYLIPTYIIIVLSYFYNSLISLLEINTI